MNTKENPGCYHSALKYFSELTGISKTKEIYFDSFDHIRSKPHKHRQNKNSFKTKLLYPSHNIKIETECGKIVSYFPEVNKRFDQCGYVPKRFIVEVIRPLIDFGINFQSAGSYTDCLGGGWTCKIQLYKHNDFYFAPNMECAH